MSEQIFLISAEAKDNHCLAPLLPFLRSAYDNVTAFDFFDDIGSNSGACLKEFATCDFPVAVIASTPMVGFLTLVRPRETFLCIGVEHGIAPFKRYTYDEELLSADFYLAPTEGWAERLRSLYPELQSKVRLGGFPKIEFIKEHTSRRKTVRSRLMSLLRGGASDRKGKILVVLSWGVDAEALRGLPDTDFIDYLLHPADFRLRDTVPFTKSGLYVSSPDVTYELIANAALIIGDFSSLSLECIYLGKHVLLMIDRT
jgi:hypothetical protein